MTTAADITVKKADGTTNITWSLVSASGGDRSPAVWKSQTATGTAGQKPTYSITARANQQGNVRRVDLSASFPSVYTNSNTGQTEVRSTLSMTASFAVPQNVVSTDVNEFASQVANLIANTATVGSIEAGYAPT
jgi:hypothetical protein